MIQQCVQLADRFPRSQNKSCWALRWRDSKVGKKQNLHKKHWQNGMAKKLSTRVEEIVKEIVKEIVEEKREERSRKSKESRKLKKILKFRFFWGLILIVINLLIQQCLN